VAGKTKIIARSKLSWIARFVTAISAPAANNLSVKVYRITTLGQSVLADIEHFLRDGGELICDRSSMGRLSTVVLDDNGA
jgi:hypothetical protein